MMIPVLFYATSPALIARAAHFITVALRQKNNTKNYDTAEIYDSLDTRKEINVTDESRTEAKVLMNWFHAADKY